ncbi:MAG TPA: hypothetical protein VEI97_03580 [bacterium]|nr:hypothetical protein [bacterium]
MKLRHLKGWIAPALLWGGSLLPVLAATARMERVTAQMRLLLWVAGLLSIFVFFLVLFRKKLATEDKIEINWEREEARLRAIAELTLKARGAEPNPPAAWSASPPLPAADNDGAALSPAMAALEARPTSSTTAAEVPLSPEPRVDSELGRIMRGLSD